MARMMSSYEHRISLFRASCGTGSQLYTKFFRVIALEGDFQGRGGVGPALVVSALRVTDAAKLCAICFR